MTESNTNMAAARSDALAASGGPRLTLASADAGATQIASTTTAPDSSTLQNRTTADLLLAAVARVLAESPHAAAMGVRRVAAQLVHDLHIGLQSEDVDANRVAQTMQTLIGVMRAWPATSTERLLVRALAGRHGVSVRRTARRPRAVTAEPS